MSPDEEVLEANLAAAALLGLERQELIHQKFSRFIPAEGQDAFYFYCGQVLRSRTAKTGELTLKSINGRSLTVWLEGIAAEDPTTHKTNCRLSLGDITERKEAERRRRADQALTALFAAEDLGRRVPPCGGGAASGSWSGAQAVGIRLVNEAQELPFAAWAGFEPGFVELENRLLLHRDNCCCMRAITQQPEGKDQRPG